MRLGRDLSRIDQVEVAEAGASARRLAARQLHAALARVLRVGGTARAVGLLLGDLALQGGISADPSPK